MLTIPCLTRANASLYLGILSCAALSCTADIGGGSGSSGPGASGAGTGPGGVPVGSNPGGVSISCDRGVAPGVSPLMKLTTVQYRNTIRDLLTLVGASAVLPKLQGLLASVPETVWVQVSAASTIELPSSTCKATSTSASRWATP